MVVRRSMVTIPNFGSQVNPSPSKKAATKKAPFSNNTSIVSASLPHSPSNLSPVVRKYFHQSLARELLPKERVAICHRRRAPFRPTVDVFKSEAAHKAYFSGLLHCGSLWHCAVCGARISEGRRQELAAVVHDCHITNEDATTTLLVPVLVTYTFQHNKGMRYKASVDGVSAAFRKMKGTRSWENFKEDYGWVGSVRALETTYGVRAGWHPHIHELVFLKINLSTAQIGGFHKSLKMAWLGALKKVSLGASWDYGVDVRVTDTDVAEYIAKFGREPLEAGWGITHELTKSGSKRSGGDGHYSMPQLLEMYGDGDLEAGRLWREYALGSKGRNQLVWSRGLRDLLGIGQEKSDGELSQETESTADKRLAAFTPDQWKAILRADVRGELLDRAASGSEEEFTLWIADILTRWMPPVEGRTVRLHVAADGSYQFS